MERLASQPLIQTTGQAFAKLLGSADSGLADSGSIDSLVHQSAIQSNSSKSVAEVVESRTTVPAIHCLPVSKQLFFELRKQLIDRHIDLTQFPYTEQVSFFESEGKLNFKILDCQSKSIRIRQDIH